jgi:hypothetical protein
MTPEVEQRILDDWHRNVKRVIAGKDNIFYPIGWAVNGIEPTDYGYGPMVKSDVLNAVWKVTGILPGDIKSSRTDRPICKARFLACWLYQECMRSSYSSTGLFLHRDQSSIRNAVSRARKLLAEDVEFQAWREQALAELS